MNMHVLVVGWFSWKDMGVTAGDLMARDIVCSWLTEAGIPFDVAVEDKLEYPEAVDWQQCPAERYSDILFVCGPFGNGRPVTDMMEHFPGARWIGVDLSLLDSLENWNPFTLLYERDSSRTAHPDLTFLAPPPKVPVVGLILAHPQKEYGKRGRHNDANEAIQRLIQSRPMAVVPIDTALEHNAGGLRSAGEVEALIAKMEVVLTTRLHGTVLALKNGVPVLSFDPVAGGAKVATQVKTIGWSQLFTPERLNDEEIAAAFAYCLTSGARVEAAACAGRAVKKLEKVRKKFMTELGALCEQSFATQG